MSSIKAIIFDLGGVLIDLDFNKTTRAFQDLGFPNFEQMFSQFKADRLFEKLETGLISEDDFYVAMQKVNPGHLTAANIRNAWNSLLLDFRLTSLDYLGTIKKHYPIFLLSNTNIIHYNAFNEKLKAQAGLEILDPLFTKCYYSHDIGLRKPNQNIYEYVLNDAGLEAATTLFIDDTNINIEGARGVGLQTHLLLPGERIENLDQLKFT